jgi:hypothetical protein
MLPKEHPDFGVMVGEAHTAVPPLSANWKRAGISPDRQSTTELLLI